MKTKRKWISKVAVSLGLLTMIGGIALSAGSSVYAAPPAQNISGNAVSDNTSDRSITIWKYEINSASELGGRGDGESLDPDTAPDLVGKKVMQDVNFEIIKVKAIGSADLTDPLQQVEGTHWEVDSSFTRQTGVTAADGSLKFDVGTGKSADGIYLVREIKDSTGEYTYTDPVSGETGLKINKPMDPFFVHLPQTKRNDTSKLIYDVHVHPKNIVTNTDLDKTAEGGKGYSIKAGQDFQWEATTALPSGLLSIINEPMKITGMHDPVTGLPTADLDITGPFPYELYADYFRITDDLNTALLLKDIVVQVTDDDGATWTDLTIGTHFNVELNGTAVAAHPVTNMTAGAAKEVEVSLTQAGMKKLTEAEDTHIRVVYKTTVEQDFNGKITNKYKIDYLIPGQEPTSEESDEPEYYNGGFDIKKTDKAGADLSGAEFHIALTEDDAKAKKYLASDGNSYTLNDDGTSTPSLPSGVAYLTSTSDATGKAHFDGLKLDWFTDNPGGANPSDGKQDPKDPTEATWDEADIKKDYWVVETKSPAGYELLKTPQKVTVTLTTHSNTDPEVTVVNETKTKLPFTGGTGTMLLIIIAIGAITIGTAAIAIDKKRRHA
ncbi:SpaH/EbpB family LPXTG-anchored major pilin [Candidatus Enterococcus murrayae]|uniref:SpaH/EbpB family LPXTG-anchored major pilin n=1 Tax=Candidatus Enterococcus murrayae TaxID=2815321 RepID=A0ABS3HJZ7_9ENTE|nr:SpaH/EbpB family LPXTG-anchored major pilin [Enterococcus sp. MJM16]MBO0453787.1 SpaH/EbpB family LPXTG-anchored major pilin [Enterococcus sp. MJM16]